MMFIAYLSDCVGLQNFIEILGGHVKCCIDSIQHDPQI
jgi:hypothetical protein